MGFLKLIGAVSAAEHETVTNQRDGLKRDLLAERLKFKNAAKDIAAQADEIAALRPDAEKHRAKLGRDRNRVRPSRAKAPTKGASK